MRTEIQKKRGGSFQRLLRTPLNYLQYLGLVIAVVLMVISRNSVQETDRTLRESVAQQSNLRNILWVNLLIQRSTNMALVANQKKNPTYFERANLTAESLGQPLGEIARDSSPLKAASKAVIRKDVGEFQARLLQLSASPARIQEFLDVAEKTGEELNQIESDGWFRLNEHNENLLTEIKHGHGLLIALLMLFLGYLVLLGLILNWKNKAEEALRSAEAKMFNSARISALGEMSGGVAHEINNPLATISLLTEQVKEELAGHPEENKFALERLGKITSTVDRISQIVLALRTFSRDGSGDGFEIVPVKEILEATLCLCQEKFKHRGISVSMEILPPDLKARIQRVQFSQVLLNLFSNACDAIEKRPEKWIRIRVADTPQGITRFEITDSGTGIPETVQEKMFNPFYTTKEIGKGTGLGLSISQGIIKSHGGKLYLDRICLNTRFNIDLPRPELDGQHSHGSVKIAKTP